MKNSVYGFILLRAMNSECIIKIENAISRSKCNKVKYHIEYGHA
jgi:hypothetical protein